MTNRTQRRSCRRDPGADLGNTVAFPGPARLPGYEIVAVANGNRDSCRAVPEALDISDAYPMLVYWPMIPTSDAQLTGTRRDPLTAEYSTTPIHGARSGTPPRLDEGAPTRQGVSSRAGSHRRSADAVERGLRDRLEVRKELQDTNVLINAACPGLVVTGLNGHRGTREPAKGAAIAVRLATLPDDGPTGGSFDDAGPVAW